MTKGLFNGIAAVFAGFVAILVLTTAVEYLLYRTGVLSPGTRTTAQLLLVIANYFVWGSAGALLTVWLGKKHNLLHAAALAAVMTAIILIPVSSNWNRNEVWYSLTMLGLPVLYSLTGLGFYRFLKR